MDLSLAIAGEGSRLQRHLELPGALQELCLRGDLADEHLPGEDLRTLDLRRLGAVEGNELPTKLHTEIPMFLFLNMFCRSSKHYIVFPLLYNTYIND